MTTAALGFEAKLTAPYDQAIDIVTTALKTEGFGVLTRIDIHAAFKEKLGIEFRPYSILGACNPALAYRALMLPCNVTVEAEETGTMVRIADPEVMLSVGGMGQDPALHAVATEARLRLTRVVESLRAHPAAAC